MGQDYTFKNMNLEVCGMLPEEQRNVLDKLEPINA